MTEERRAYLMQIVDQIMRIMDQQMDREEKFMISETLETYRSNESDL